MPLLNSPTGIALQERDFNLLRGLFDSRVLTLSHISRLYFDGKDEATKKRVQKLKGAKLVAERPRRAYEPSVLYLTKNALQLLHQHGHLAEFPHVPLTALERRAQVSKLTIQHELDVQDVKTALTLAVNAKAGFRMAEFLTWPLLYQFEVPDPLVGSGFSRGNILVKPDGFIRIVEHGPDGERFEQMFFLEVDRSTESQEVIARRAAAYREYYRTGRFAEWRGGEKNAFAEYPFRVLWVFQSEQRRRNSAEAMLKLTPPILKQCWLATKEAACTAPLSAAWLQPDSFLTAKRLRTPVSNSGMSLFSVSN